MVPEGIPAATPSKYTRRAALALLPAPLLASCTALAPDQFFRLSAQMDQGDVDFTELHDHALRVQDAHKTETEIRALRRNTVKVGSLPVVDVRYYVERDDRTKTQTVSLPGSFSLRDWLEDFDIFFAPDTTIGVPLHRGFEVAAQALHADVQPHLRKGYRTVLAGHSMGGSLAVILGAYLANDGFKVARITTFGQPRVTNAAGVRALSHLPLTRVVNAGDLISMVPTFPFEQFGAEVILHRGPHYVFLSPEDANRISLGELWRELHQLDAGSHELDLYVGRLAEKRAGAQPVPYAQR